ncbi:MAG TPA: hypothetical protein VM717_04535 [Chthoniobacterales bacterium]|nr:hypothetical protein [Chthoniobacterales bacterium]
MDLPNEALFFHSHYIHSTSLARFGPNVEEGIVGIGPTVEAALRAFDPQDLVGLRPPTEGLRRGFRSKKPTPRK